MQERTLTTTNAFTGRRIKLDVVAVELEPGTRATREIVRTPGAVAVVASLPDGRLVFVRQFRKAVEQELLEVPAGCLEPGEDAPTCAAREVEEETGYTVRALHSLGLLYPSPGFCDELICLFHAELKDGPAQQHTDGDERIAVVCLTRREFDDMILQGRIADGKTLAAWLLFTRKSGPPRPTA
jgi:ADP-ribose pyrophosphatase